MFQQRNYQNNSTNTLRATWRHLFREHGSRNNETEITVFVFLRITFYSQMVTTHVQIICKTSWTKFFFSFSVHEASHESLMTDPP